MPKASIDIITTSKYGVESHKYWVYAELIDDAWDIKYQGSRVKTDEEVFDDLGLFIYNLLMIRDLAVGEEK